MTLPQVLRRRLGLVGVALLVCSVAVPLLLAAVVVDGASAQTHVAGDGVPQRIAVPDGRTMMVWLDSSVTEPVCAVEDGNGNPAGLVEVADGPRQSAGSAGDWVGTFTFEVAGETASVSCEGVGQPARGALVTPASGSLSGLSGVAVLVAVALTLAAAGLGCMARADTRDDSFVA
jgi:hypothetical protein